VPPAWTPAIPEGAAPLYERLVAALRADIASGALAAGARLPPQRDLAYRLGVGLGTVTRAYVEAEKAGLVSAHVGRGSFVNASGRLSGAMEWRMRRHPRPATDAPTFPPQPMETHR